jgi:hypothetical protein
MRVRWDVCGDWGLGLGRRRGGAARRELAAWHRVAAPPGWPIGPGRARGHASAPDGARRASAARLTGPRPAASRAPGRQPPPPPPPPPVCRQCTPPPAVPTASTLPCSSGAQASFTGPSGSCPVGFGGGARARGRKCWGHAHTAGRGSGNPCRLGGAAATPARAPTPAPTRAPPPRRPRARLFRVQQRRAAAALADRAAAAARPDLHGAARARRRHAVAGLAVGAVDDAAAAGVGRQPRDLPRARGAFRAAQRTSRGEARPRTALAQDL